MHVCVASEIVEYLGSGRLFADSAGVPGGETRFLSGAGQWWKALGGGHSHHERTFVYLVERLPGLGKRLQCWHI
jgi:hypothetical protein